LTNLSAKKTTKIRDKEKFKVFVWALFDLAHTSYSIVVITFIYAVYFKQVIFEGKPVGDFFWSLCTGISMLITAFISPILGAIADYSAGRKRFLLFFSIICIIATALLYFIGKGDVFYGMLFFIIANIGYQAGVVFYDSFLPDITAPKNYGRVSGYGFAMGYLGSLITLAFVYPFIKANMIRETFPLSALIFTIFAVPLFIFLKDNRKSITHSESFISIGFKRVINTLKHLKNYKNLSLFLLAFFFYVEGINTVIFFSGNYASSTLHFSFMQLIVFFLIVQTTAILGAVLFGVLADSYGQKKTIILSLFIWIFTILIAYNTSGKNSPLVLFAASKLNMDRDTVVRGFFYLVGLSAGSVMGGTQSVSRSLMSKLTPPDRKTEFFGFYSFFGKSSAILGPFVFGIVSYATGQQRLAILTIGIFFVVGLAILNYVNDPKTAELIKAGD
jgi:UMF1 family MFS transporter